MSSPVSWPPQCEACPTRTGGRCDKSAYFATTKLFELCGKEAALFIKLFGLGCASHPVENRCFLAVLSSNSAESSIVHDRSSIVHVGASVVHSLYGGDDAECDETSDMYNRSHHDSRGSSPLERYGPLDPPTTPTTTEDCRSVGGNPGTQAEAEASDDRPTSLRSYRRDAEEAYTLLVSTLGGEVRCDSTFRSLHLRRLTELGLREDEVVGLAEYFRKTRLLTGRLKNPTVMQVLDEPLVIEYRCRRRVSEERRLSAERVLNRRHEEDETSLHNLKVLAEHGATADLRERAAIVLKEVQQYSACVLSELVGELVEEHESVLSEKEEDE